MDGIVFVFCKTLEMSVSEMEPVVANVIVILSTSTCADTVVSDFPVEDSSKILVENSSLILVEKYRLGLDVVTKLGSVFTSFVLDHGCLRNHLTSFSVKVEEAKRKKGNTSTSSAIIPIFPNNGVGRTDRAGLDISWQAGSFARRYF